MLVFRRSARVLPVHCAPSEVRTLHPLAAQEPPNFRSQDDPWGGRGAPSENLGLWTTCAETGSDQFYVPKFAELARVVLVVRKGNVIEQRPGTRVPRLSPAFRLFVSCVHTLGVIHERRREMP